jgi:hypothetical protein
MNKPVVGICTLAAAMAFATPVLAQTSSTAPAKVMDAEAKMQATEITAVITALDLKNRIVTLKGPAGNEFAVVVDPAVKGLQNVKIGDTVSVKYYQAVALDFKKGDGIRMMTVSTAAGAGTKKTMPGVSGVQQVTTVSNIWAINAASGTVTVRGPLGHFFEVALKDPKMLDGVKVGDQMQVTFTEAVAVAVNAVKQ